MAAPAFGLRARPLGSIAPPLRGHRHERRRHLLAPAHERAIRTVPAAPERSAAAQRGPWARGPRTCSRIAVADYARQTAFVGRLPSSGRAGIERAAVRVGVSDATTRTRLTLLLAARRDQFVRPRSSRWETRAVGLRGSAANSNTVPQPLAPPMPCAGYVEAFSRTQPPTCRLE